MIRSILGNALKLAIALAILYGILWAVARFIPGASGPVRVVENLTQPHS